MHGQQVQVTICPPATETQMQANGRAGFRQTMAIKVSSNSAERTTGTVRAAHHDPAGAYQPIEELREEVLNESPRAWMSETARVEAIRQRRVRPNPYLWRDWCSFLAIETKLSAREYFACHPITRSYTPHPGKKAAKPRKPFTRDYARRETPAAKAVQ